MAHIFISYSTADKVYASKLAQDLVQNGFDVWIDQHRLHSSDDWWKSIVFAVRECSAFIVIMSPNSDSSRWVQREVTLADKYKKPIFPLLLDGTADTPNWEMFVRTQFDDVRNGSLPSRRFYEAISTHVQRQQKRGSIVTKQITPAQANAIDATLSEDMNNVPTPDFAAPTRANRPRSGPVMLMVLLVVVILLAGLAYIVQNQMTARAAIAFATGTAEAFSSAATATSEAAARSTIRVILEPDIDEDVSPEDLEATARTIARRIDLLNISTAEVQVQGERVLVDLPNLEDINSVIETIEKTALLELVDFSDVSAAASSYEGRKISTSEQVDRGYIDRFDGNAITEPMKSPRTGQPFPTVITGDSFVSTEAVQIERISSWVVEVHLDEADSIALQEYTSTHIGQVMAISIDGVVISVPQINSELNDMFMISGAFTEQEVKALALQMRAGSLKIPMKLALIEQLAP